MANNYRYVFMECYGCEKSINTLKGTDIAVCKECAKKVRDTSATTQTSNNPRSKVKENNNPILTGITDDKRSCIGCGCPMHQRSDDKWIHDIDDWNDCCKATPFTIKKTFYKYECTKCKSNEVLQTCVPEVPHVLVCVCQKCDTRGFVDEFLVIQEKNVLPTMKELREHAKRK